MRGLPPGCSVRRALRGDAEHVASLLRGDDRLEMEALEGSPVLLGSLDITLYRDDLSTIGPNPVVKRSDLPFEADKAVVKFDGPKMTYTPGGPAIAFHEEVRPTGGPAPVAQVLVSQSFYRNGDRYREEDGERATD